MRNLILFSGLLVLCTSVSCKKSETPSNPTLPVLSMTDQVFYEGDDNNTVSLTLTLNQASSGTVIVNCSSVEVTAADNLDFKKIIDAQVVFNAGSTTANLNLEIYGDEVEENDETLEVILLNPVGATLGNTKATIEIKNDDMTSGFGVPSGGYSTPTSYAGMTLTWSDEFKASSLNESDWTYEIGTGSSGWGNNELQYYREQNTSLIEGDYLMIEARRENFGGQEYTSSRLITADKQEFKFGRVDIRAALPEGQGVWPALWMLGSNFFTGGWPQCGEIDIMELVGHEPHKVHGSAHYGNTPGERQYLTGTRALSGNKKFSQEFHVFSILWENDKIEYLVDDIKYFEFNTSKVVNGQPYPFNNDFFFIFNVAVGGDWPGSPDPTTFFPQRMFVDYIRVFQ